MNANEAFLPIIFFQIYFRSFLRPSHSSHIRLEAVKVPFRGEALSWGGQLLPSLSVSGFLPLFLLHRPPLLDVAPLANARVAPSPHWSP